MKSRQLIEALGADDVDPKDVALNTEFDSELFREFMHNYQEECRKLLKKAEESGALQVYRLLKRYFPHGL